MPMRNKCFIEITDSAEQDLENLGDYIALELKSPSTALNTVIGIKQSLLCLGTNPSRHVLDEDVKLTCRIGCAQTVLSKLQELLYS